MNTAEYIKTGLIQLIFAWILSFMVTVVSCKKQETISTVPPPVYPTKKKLLKDINRPGLPTPYYHFEYRTDSLIKNVSFASGFNNYNVFYNGNNISEMRNNIIVNHDTLRYFYDNGGRIAMIRFIAETGIIYRHVAFSYDEQKVKEIKWEHLEANSLFAVDRVLTLTYHADGNVKEISEHRPATASQAAFTYSISFDEYDDKVNVDDFTLIHDSIHDHVLLLGGLRIQKNNHHKEIRTGFGLNYKANYSYLFNEDGTPLKKTGTVLFTNGSSAGQTFQSITNYSYY
jgi:hypothetical protein